jgi:hypothetical protein
MGFLCAHTMIMLLLPVAQQGSKSFHAALLSGSASILLELPFTVVCIHLKYLISLVYITCKKSAVKEMLKSPK